MRHVPKQCDGGNDELLVSKTMAWKCSIFSYGQALCQDPPPLERFSCGPASSQPHGKAPPSSGSLFLPPLSSPDRSMAGPVVGTIPLFRSWPFCFRPCSPRPETSPFSRRAGGPGAVTSSGPLSRSSMEFILGASSCIRAGRRFGRTCFCLSFQRMRAVRFHDAVGVILRSRCGHLAH